MVLAAIRSEIYTMLHIILKLKKERFSENVGKHGRYEKKGREYSSVKWR
jgi:hypothetical protein